MGKLLDALKGAGIALDQQKQARVLALDREFSEKEARVQALEAENLRLQARVNPLERQVEQLTNEIARSRSQDEGPLDTLSEQLLKVIAENAQRKYAKDQVIRLLLELPQAKGDYLFDVLHERRLITIRQTNAYGPIYHATPKGRRYLAEHNLL